MVKIFLKLFYKDLFYYKDESDSRHKSMHNLSGLFLKEEATKILDDITYYSFSIIFPKKKRTYFCDNKQEFKGWKKRLRIATNYSNILQMYEISNIIGVGSFSTVKLATNKVTNQKVAVKIVTKNKLSTPILESTLTEIEIMKICQFPYIIKFIEAYENIEFIYIFMEYCPGGTLFNFLKRKDYNLNEKLCSNIIYKVCLAVNYFHSYGIAHRDLKLDNILMTSEDDEADIRILDFGLGKIIGPNEKCSEPYGTVIYCAPEIILCQPYTKIVDSWSIGVITYILLLGRIPFYDESKSVIRKLIVKEKPVYKGYDLPVVSEYAINFMQKFLTKNPDKRMTVEQALKHKWFQVFNKENVIKINQSINTQINEYKNRNNIIQYFYQN
jgi:calcium-dependent protein kinase